MLVKKIKIKKKTFKILDLMHYIYLTCATEEDRHHASLNCPWVT